MKYKSLFIDLDDTLWDTYHNNKECLEEVYAAHHFDRYYASFEAFFDIYWPHNNLLWEQYRNNEIDRQTLIIERFRYMLRPLGIEDTKSVLEINNDFLQRTTRKTRLVPGAIELLEYLRPSYRMYILSNGFREVQFKSSAIRAWPPISKRRSFPKTPASRNLIKAFSISPLKHQLPPERKPDDRRQLGSGYHRCL